MPININNLKIQMVNRLGMNLNHIKEAIRICLIQDFEADFLWKVNLRILNSGMILKTVIHEHIHRGKRFKFWSVSSFTYILCVS